MPPPLLQKTKLIIDTDPGIDDAMAILLAFSSREVEVIAITTVFGNVGLTLATQNVLKLCHMAGHKQMLIAHGCEAPINGVDSAHIADHVHGKDGLGNVDLPDVQGDTCGNAPQVIVDLVNAHPGEVTILAIGPLANIAQALKIDPTIGTKWKELVIMGGAFYCSGNINPAAEANIYNDPSAADMVFKLCSDRVKVIGLDVTLGCKVSRKQLSALQGQGQYGDFIFKISQFYCDLYKHQYGFDGMCVHDAAAMACILDPSLFKFKQGGVCVAVEGVAKGMTILEDVSLNWHSNNAWTDRSKVHVALEVDSEKVAALLLERLGARPNVARPGMCSQLSSGHVVLGGAWRKRISMR